MSKPTEAEEQAAKILFDACSIAKHSFDAATRKEALARITSGLKEGLTPSGAAYAVASYFLLAPEWDEGTLVIKP